MFAVGREQEPTTPKDGNWSSCTSLVLISYRQNLTVLTICPHLTSREARYYNINFGWPNAQLRIQIFFITREKKEEMGIGA